MPAPLSIRALAVALLLLGLTVAAPSPARAAGDAAYRAELSERARAAHLAEGRMWRLLLHDRPGRLRPLVSDVDGRDFFLAPGGKTDPAAELDATLAAFFQPPVDPAAGQHPQCRFNARYRWLKAQLAFDPERLPEQPCERLEAWLKGLNATGVVLVYPAAYLNSPPSMFGHTFLRLDNPDKPQLLDYALNYAALVPEDEGPLYAAKGLLGFFPGRFTILPYYAKVQSYAELENRDIWEYRLTLEPGEIDRMLRHAWELGPTYFDYFFLRENCSYHLLSLLEVARPKLDLTSGFRHWTVPTDTLRGVTAAPGLVADVRFRPARGTVIRHREAGLPRARVAAARSLAVGTGEPVAPDAAVLDLAHDYLLYLEADRSGDAAILKARRHQVLLARSALGGADPSTDVPPPAVRPEQGHGTQRAIAAMGTRHGHGFVELGYRAAYHDLLDPLPGYDRHAQLGVFDGALRYRPDDGRLALERLTALDILSVAPVDGFFNPRSWKVSAGYRAGRAGECVGCGTARFNFGPGVAAAVGDAAVVYGFAEVDAHYGPRLERDHALGPGARLGTLFAPAAGLRLWLDGAVFRSLSGERDRVWEVAAGQSLDLEQNRAVRLEAEGRDSRFGRVWEGRLSVAAYW
ncbi:MAG: DUF4105 domain-containing protein [Nitrospirae bacterium]|nr:DUF4105 domain-containing protein [Nitrospirota bacterium]